MRGLKALMIPRCPKAVCRPASFLHGQVQSRVKQHSLWKQSEGRKSRLLLSTELEEVLVAPGDQQCSPL